VRNRSEGTIEALFAGEAEDVAQMIEACRKGPWSAKVDGVERSEGNREQLAMRRVGEKFSVLATL
jgi:acylphosphatase